MLLALYFTQSCTSFQAEYANPSEVELINDKWNETDARVSSEHLVKNALESPWLNDYELRYKKRPIVVVSSIENRTDEHIDTRALSETIRNSLINSRQVRYVNKRQRQEILDEMNYQNSGAVDPGLAKRIGKQIGADYLLTGSISSIVAANGKRKNVVYQVEAALTNLQTAEVEWTNIYRSKKKFRR